MFLLQSFCNRLARNNYMLNVYQWWSLETRSWSLKIHFYESQSLRQGWPTLFHSRAEFVTAWPLECQTQCDLCVRQQPMLLHCCAHFGKVVLKKCTRCWEGRIQPVGCSLGALALRFHILSQSKTYYIETLNIQRYQLSKAYFNSTCFCLLYLHLQRKQNIRLKNVLLGSSDNVCYKFSRKILEKLTNF